MEKKNIIWIAAYIFVFVWLFLIGQAGHSAVFGDINFIDEGQYAAWANQMLNGKIIYKEIYVQYGPFMVFPVFLLMKFFGETIFFVYLWFFISTFLGYIIGILALRKLKVDKITFFISAVTLLIIPGINIRQWIGVLVFIILLKSYKTRSLILSFISGVLITVSILQSVEIGIFTLSISTAYIMFRLIKSKNLKKELIVTFLLACGTLLSAVLFFLIFQNQGWLMSYFYTTKEFAASISGMNLPNGKGLPDIIQNANISSLYSLFKFIFSKNMLFYWSLFLLLIFFPIFIIRLTQKKIQEKDIFGFLITNFAIVIYFSIVGRSGHYISVFPYVIILTAYFVTEIKEFKLHKEHIRKLYFISIIIFCLYILRHVAIYRFSLIPKIDKLSNTKIQRVYPLKISVLQSRDILELQKFFSLNSNDNDSIYILNNASGLYFLLDKRNPTRYDLPLLAGTIERRYEIVNDLIKHKPLYVLEDKTSWAVDEVSDEKRMPEIFEYVKKNYYPYKRIGHFLIFKLIEK